MRAARKRRRGREPLETSIATSVAEAKLPNDETVSWLPVARSDGTTACSVRRRTEGVDVRHEDVAWLKRYCLGPVGDQDEKTAHDEQEPAKHR